MQNVAIIHAFVAGMGAFFNCMLIALDRIQKEHAGKNVIPIVEWIAPHYSNDPHENIWHKYFELVGFPSLVDANSDVNIVAHYKADYDDKRMDYRRTLHDLYAKHVRVKSIITDRVDAIFRPVTESHSHPHSHYHVVGVHLRNTDRCVEPQYASPGVAYVSKRLNEEIQKLDGRPVYLFIASDNKPDAEYIKSHVDPTVIVLEDPDAVRSDNHISVHGTHDAGMRSVPNDAKALSVLTDIFCLARCELIVRTCSNVSSAAGIINTNAKIVDVSLEMGRYTETWLSEIQ